MKRSLIAFLLLAAIMLCCAGCELPAEEENAYTLVNSAIEKTQALDAAHMKLDMDMSMKVAGVSMSVPMEYDIKATGLTGESPKMNMTMKMEMLGMSVDMDFYMENGYYYLSYMGQKMKFKTEGMDEYDSLGQIESMMPKLDERYFQDIPVVKNRDGSKTVTITLSNDAFQAVFKDLIDSTGNSASQGAQIESVMISNATVKITVGRSGYIEEYQIVFDMNMSMGVSGVTTSTSVSTDAKVTYVDPGKSVTVTPPEGYLSYPETNIGDLG